VVNLKYKWGYHCLGKWVTILKRKFVLIFMAIALSTLALTTSVKAAANVQIYGYVDKTQYMPGDTVTLTFYIYNYGPDEIVLKNVTIYYPWYSPIWGGNETIKNINAVISEGKNWNTTKTFTIPTDGRAVGSEVTIEYKYTIGTTVYTRSDDISINLVSAPDYGSLKDMDKLVTLFTVQVVLLIVCTIIIAATIFLTAHKPQVTWKAEEKAQ
jgi:hypothetical protein